MLIATPAQKGVVMTIVEGVPLFVLAAVLWWLRPQRAAASAVFPEYTAVRH
jgi:hypothetical protein